MLEHRPTNTIGGAVDISAASIMLRDARRELNEARVRVAHLEQVVDGLTGLLNTAGVDVGVSRPGGDSLPGYASPSQAGVNMRPRDAVLYVLKRRPGYNFTPRRVYDYLVDHGMVNTEMKSGIAAYDMALRRLADESDSGVERNEERGTYIYRRGVTSMSSARNRVSHSADGRPEVDQRDIEGDLALVLTAHERERMLLARGTEDERIRRDRSLEARAREGEQKRAQADREKMKEAERNLRELEAKFGSGTRSKTDRERRRDDT